MKKLLALVMSGIFALGVPLSARAQEASSAASGGGSSKAKIFLTTSTYGVMAGSLVGLASLTFYRQPGKKLRNVAIGASLGLYTGLLLGAYMVYFVPDPNQPRSSESTPAAPSLDSDDPLNLGTQPQSYIEPPRFLPVAAFDGEAVHVGVDYRF